MNITININPRRIVRGLIYFTVSLLLAGIISHILKYSLGLLPGLFHWFNIDGEKNFPAAFASALLLLCAALLLLITVAKQTAQDSSARHWAGLVGVFSLLATDEWLSYHERVGEFIQTRLPASGVFHFAWIIAGIAFVALIGLIYIRFLWRLPQRYRRLFLMAAGIYILGAIGMEMVAGYYADQQQQWSRTLWLAMTTVEEGLEMVGVLTFLYALLTYVQDSIGELNICIVPFSEQPSTRIAISSVRANRSHRK
jgi:hypothetical protein